MDSKKLISWKNDPSLIGKDEIAELENLLQDFPYLSLGQVLLARGYKNIDHYKYDKQVKKAAMYCQDRTWLYHFLNQTEVVAKKEVAKIAENKKEHKPKEIKLPVTDVLEETKPITKSVSMPKMVLDTSKSWKNGTKNTLLSEEEAPAIPPPVTEKLESKEGVEKSKSKKKDIDKDVRPPEVKAEDKADTMETQKENPKVDKQVDLASSTDQKEVKPKKLKSKKAKGNSKKGKKKKKREKTVILDDKVLLDELISQNVSYNIEEYFSSEDIEEKEEEVIEVDGAMDFFSWLKETNKADKKKPKKKASKIKNSSEGADKTRNIIDGFLNANPLPSKKKANFFTPVEMAKQSDILESEIVSETLASVYEEQEYYEEAILTYEKLILLFPQKEPYFAARIKELRKK